MMPLELGVVDKRRDPSSEDGCPLLPSPSALSLPNALPLEAYLMDENDHERRFLRLSGCPSLGSVEPQDVETKAASRMAEPCGSSDAPSSGDVGSDDDEVPESQDGPRTAQKRKLEEASGSEGEQRQKMGRPASATEARQVSGRIGAGASAPTMSSASSPCSSAPDSAASDLFVAEAPLATRHFPLHHVLQDAGLGGLGNNTYSALRYHRQVGPGWSGGCVGWLAAVAGLAGGLGRHASRRASRGVVVTRPSKSRRNGKARY